MWAWPSGVLSRQTGLKRWPPGNLELLAASVTTQVTGTVARSSDVTPVSHPSEWSTRTAATPTANTTYPILRMFSTERSVGVKLQCEVWSRYNVTRSPFVSVQYHWRLAPPWPKFKNCYRGGIRDLAFLTITNSNFQFFIVAETATSGVTLRILERSSSVRATFTAIRPVLRQSSRMSIWNMFLLSAQSADRSIDWRWILTAATCLANKDSITPWIFF